MAQDACREEIRQERAGQHQFSNGHVKKSLPFKPMPTKQRFRLPIWVFIPLLAIALAVFFFPRAYSILTHSISGQSLHESASNIPAPAGLVPAADVRVFSTTVTVRGYFEQAGSITLLLSDGRVIFQPQQFKTFPGGFEAQIAPDLWVRGGAP